jgi:hypothetical protein
MLPSSSLVCIVVVVLVVTVVVRSMGGRLRGRSVLVLCISICILSSFLSFYYCIYMMRISMYMFLCAMDDMVVCDIL